MTWLVWMWRMMRFGHWKQWPQEWEKIKRMQRMIYEEAADKRTNGGYVNLQKLLTVVNESLPAVQAGDRLTAQWPTPRDR